MKKLIFLFSALAFLVLTSCGGSSKSATTNETAESEVKKLDSLTTEMDEVSTEIDNNTKALEDALKDLESEFDN